MLVHFYWLSRRRIDVPALYEPPGAGRLGDFRWDALTAFVLGIIATWFFEFGVPAALQGPGAGGWATSTCRGWPARWSRASPTTCSEAGTVPPRPPGSGPRTRWPDERAAAAARPGRPPGARTGAVRPARARRPLRRRRAARSGGGTARGRGLHRGRRRLRQPPVRGTAHPSRRDADRRGAALEQLRDPLGRHRGLVRAQVLRHPRGRPRPRRAGAAVAGRAGRPARAHALRRHRPASARARRAPGTAGAGAGRGRPADRGV